MKRRFTHAGVLTLLTAALLWSVSYCFLLGDLGKWADDYWWGNRDQQSGEPIVWARLAETPKTARPLHNLVTSFLQTVFWRQDWMNHLVSAVSHGLTTVMLYVLLCRLGRARSLAAAGSLAFLVLPWQFEVPLWNSAIATSLGTTTFLVMCLVQIEFQCGRLRAGMAWPLLVALGVMIPCWNEQPAAGIFALPLLALAVPAPGVSLKKRVVRAFGPAAIGAVVFVVYMLLLRQGLPEGARGGIGSMTPPDRWWIRARNLVFAIGKRYTLWQFGGAALKTGAAVIRDSSLWKQAWVGVAAVAAIGWGAANVCRDEPEEASTGISRGWLVAFAAAGFIGSWMPCLLVARAGADWRLSYFASLFMVVGATTALEPVARKRSGGAMVIRRCVSVVLSAGMAASMVLLVGVQAAHARSWQLDQRVAAQLPRLLPNPAPDTSFIPVRVDALAMHTGSRLFDLQFRCAMEYRGSAPLLAQMAYRRRDIHAGSFRRYTPPFTTVILGETSEGLRMSERVGGTVGPSPEGGWILPIARAVPIVIDEDDTVRLVTTLVLVRAGATIARVDIPQARGQPVAEIEVQVP